MDYKEYIDIEDAMDRFLNNKAMYEKFLFKFLDEERFEKLKIEIDKKDAQRAFEEAHNIKGVVSNLSLKKMSDFINPIVESLRIGELPEDSAIEQLKVIYDDTRAVIEKIKNQEISL